MTTRIREVEQTLYTPVVGDLTEYMPTQPVVRALRVYAPRFPVLSIVEHWLWIGVRAFGWMYLIFWGGAVGGLLLQELA